MDYKILIKAAREAKRFSFSPYSKFRVGAAILAKSGKIFSGCNVENSSFSLTICAERTAIFKAVSEGTRKFKAIAIATDKKNLIPPCGACRQVLMDITGDIDIILVSGNGKSKLVRLSELLPMPFDSSLLIIK